MSTIMLIYYKNVIEEYAKQFPIENFNVWFTRWGQNILLRDKVSSTPEESAMVSENCTEIHKNEEKNNRVVATSIICSNSNDESKGQVQKNTVVPKKLTSLSRRHSSTEKMMKGKPNMKYRSHMFSSFTTSNCNITKESGLAFEVAHDQISKGKKLTGTNKLSYYTTTIAIIQLIK
jgi:hypothetical protein